MVNAKDMERAVRFWSAALRYQHREPGCDPEFMMLVDPEGRRTPLSLQLTDSDPTQPVRVHLDLYTDEQQRHVARLVGLGATQMSGHEWPYPSDADFVALRDPDGNEFCVIGHAEL